MKTRSSAIAVIADRTTCSILTLFTVIATSRPLNKKSVRCQSADPTITADLRPQSALRTGCSRTAGPVAPFTAPCHCWQTSRLPCTRVAWIQIDTYGASLTFSLRFLWCILWLNDTSYSKSVWKMATVAEFGDCHRIIVIVILSPNSLFSATVSTVAVFGDKLLPKSATIVSSVDSM